MAYRKRSWGESEPAKKMKRAKLPKQPRRKSFKQAAREGKEDAFALLFIGAAILLYLLVMKIWEIIQSMANWLFG